MEYGLLDTALQNPFHFIEAKTTVGLLYLLSDT
jgi:hypothetical protein